VGHDPGGLVEPGKISGMSQPACGGGGADARDGWMDGWMDVSSSLSFLSPSCLSI
jgi:hypothetical protein